MPELPEVNTVAKIFRQTVLGKRVAQVKVYDDKILRRDSSAEFAGALHRRHFVGTHRHGKYFFAELDNGQYILFHLGMTGDLHYYHEDSERPRFIRLEIFFNSGLILGYEDLRKFSRVLIVPDLKRYIQEVKLGPDALRIRWTNFSDLFENRGTSLKALLMNQQLLAGIGNLYADEICYQSRIHPGSRAGALKAKQRKVLYEKMKSILKLACRKNAYYKVYPKDWFWEWRKVGVKIPGKGYVRKTKIAGRTTFYVENFQKKID